MIILVTGGRYYDDAACVDRVLSAMHESTPITHLIHGDASGLDHLAHCWAKDHGVQPVACEALWGYYYEQGKPKAAGPIRNRAMAALRPDLVVAFPGGKGTANMEATAISLGLPVRRVQ